MKTPKLQDRLEIRLAAADRKVLEDAADREQRRLSDWCRLVLLAAAQKKAKIKT